MAFRIFFHSIRMVFSQFNDAVRISALLYIVTAVFSGFALFSWSRAADAGISAGLIWLSIIVLLVTTVLSIWTAVAWHRFVLIDEDNDSPIPLFERGRILAYFGRTVQATIVTFIVGLVFGAIMGIVSAWTQAGWVSAAIPLVTGFVSLFLLYRLGPLFPAAAIGSDLTFWQAWATTRNAGWTILGIAVITVLAAIAIDLPIQAFQYLPFGGILALIWMLVTGWIKLIVGISVVTTLYGVYVDKRAIV